MAPTILITPLLGVLADRYSRKAILVLSLLVFGTSGMAIAFTTDFIVVLLLRVLQGIGFAGILPVIVASLGDLYSGSREATAQGIRFASSGIASAVFPVLSGLLVVVAWQLPFLIYGVAIPVAALILFRYDVPTKTRRQKETAKGRPSEYVLELLGIVRQPYVIALLVAILVPGFMSYAFFTYISFVIVRIVGRSPGIAGAVLTLNSFIYAVASSQSGRLTQVFSGRIGLLVFAYVMFGGGLALFGLSSTLLLAFVAAVLIGVGKGIVFSILRSLNTELPPTHLRGGFVSLGESALRIGSTIAPPALGFAVAVLQVELGFLKAIQTMLILTGLTGGLIGIAAILIVAWRGDFDPSIATDAEQSGASD
jgi:MFS family permease